MSVLKKAQEIVKGDRRKDYGNPRIGFDRVALVWSGILGQTVTGEQVALCMVGLKSVRESMKHKEDNIVDIVGYAAVLEEIIEDRKGWKDPTVFKYFDF